MDALCDKVYTIDEIRAIATPIAKSHGVAALYLFGSYARGDATSESDLDFRIERDKSARFFSSAVFFAISKTVSRRMPMC